MSSAGAVEFDVREVLQSLESLEDFLSPDQLKSALLECGHVIQASAVDKAPVDTGTLRRNIVTREAEDENGETAVTVGVHEDSEVTYATYLEYGTGIYAENGNGRKTPWKWQGTGVKWGAGQDKSAWHTTVGMQPRPYIRPAFEESLDKCENILLKRIEEAMGGN